MVAQTRLKELAERKRLLVLQADLHRAVLQVEVMNARDRLAWVGQVREKLTGPWPLVGGAAAGLLLVRKWRTALKWIPAGVSAWRWFKKLKAT